VLRIGVVIVDGFPLQQATQSPQSSWRMMMMMIGKYPQTAADGGQLKRFTGHKTAIKFKWCTKIL